MIRLRGHTKAVTAVAFAPDGRRLASASKDYTLRLWELPAGTGRVLFQGGTDLYEEDTDLAVSPDGRWLVSTSVRHGLRVWDAGTGKRKRRLVNTPNLVYDRRLAFDPVRPRLLATDWISRRRDGRNQQVRAWDTDTWAELDPLVPPTDAAVAPLVFATAGGYSTRRTGPNGLTCGRRANCTPAGRRPGCRAVRSSPSPNGGTRCG